MENIVLKEAIIMASSTNSNNMCRLCLSANGITEPICYDQRDQFLLQKIYECTTLQISPLNGIPSSLCTLCKARLDEFYQFRWQCIKNDEIIRRIADSFHSNKPTVVDSSAASPITSQSPSQNPKQEVIDLHPTEVPTVVDGRSSTEYNSGSGGEEREVIIGYGEHMDHSMGVRPHQEGYSLGEQGHPGHGQYAIGPSVVPYNGEHAPGFHPEHKYPEPHQYDFSDFRRKRGRPPKQKYDVYHHPIVKYDESSIDTKSSAHVPSSSMSQESGSRFYNIPQKTIPPKPIPQNSIPQNLIPQNVPFPRISLPRMNHSPEYQSPEWTIPQKIIYLL